MWVLAHDRVQVEVGLSRVETAGRSVQLQGRRLLVATSVAAGLGLVMVLLTELVLLHLH